MQSTLGPVFSVGGGVDRPPGDLAEDFHEASKITRITHTGWTDVRFVQLLAAQAATGDRRSGGTGADEGPSGGLGEPTSAPGLLPARALAPRRPLHVPTSDAMERRRSAPATALGGGVSFADASDVLHYAYCERDDASRPSRFVPSGGALYPLDLYLVAATVDGLPAGVYQLDPLRRALVNPFGRSGLDRIERFRHAAPSLMAPIAANASATIVVTASFERARYKYGLRGYRLSLLEAGHVVQNAALAASALGLRSLGWVGFVDHELDDLLDLDGVTSRRSMPSPSAASAMRAEVRPVAGAPAVEFRGVSKAFGDAAALRDASFSLAPGGVHALLGPNGSGKTTAIDILTGGRRADAGEVRAFGHRVRRGGPTAFLVSLMPQAVDFPEYLTCREVLTLYLAHYPQAAPVDEVLRRFDLVGIAARQTGGLSGGQARSLALACAVGANTSTVVLDEPSASLDVFGRERVARVVGEVRDRGVTVLLASHDMQEVERLADSILCLRRGEVLGQWDMDDFRAKAGYRTVTFATSLPAVRVRELCRAGGLDARPDERIPGRWHVDTDRSDAAARLLLDGTGRPCLTITQPGISEVFERIVASDERAGVTA